MWFQLEFNGSYLRSVTHLEFNGAYCVIHTIYTYPNKVLFTQTSYTLYMLLNNTENHDKQFILHCIHRKTLIKGMLRKNPEHRPSVSISTKFAVSNYKFFTSSTSS